MGNIYELVIGQCIEVPESKFVYIYFKDEKYEDLFVLLSEAQLAVNASIKKMEGWIHFERMNE